LGRLAVLDRRSMSSELEWLVDLEWERRGLLTGEGARGGDGNGSDGA